MKRNGHGHAAAHELIVAARTPGQIDTLARFWQWWCDWCRTNHLRALPAQSLHIRRFLHCQIEFWGAPMMRTTADAISEAHRHLGYSDPTVGQITNYLATVARAQGASHTERIKMAPLRMDHALQICASPALSPPTYRLSAARQRVVLAACRVHAVSVGSLHTATVTVDAHGAVHIERAGRPGLVLGADDAPQLHEEARLLIREAGGHLGSSQAILASLRGTVSRSGLSLGRLRVPDLDDDQLAWLHLWADAGFLRNLRDRTLVVAGVALARRGIELCRFDASDFVGGVGWDVTVRRSKTDRGFRGIQQYLGHLDPEEEHPWCPACAISVWLHVLERRYGAPWTGPLFPAHVGGKGRPHGRMGTYTVDMIVKRLWARAGMDSDARVGSRSLRVGGVTTAHDAGMSVEEIAAEVSVHRCLEACHTYIRTDNRQFHLPV